MGNEKTKEMRHTPGPWETFRDRTGMFRVKAVYGWEGLDDSQLLPVKWISDGVNAEANAALIAAAPELLEALKEVQGDLICLTASAADCDRVEALGRLIAKAEGKVEA